MEEIGHLGYLCFVYIKPSHLTDATLDVKYKRKKKKKKEKEKIKGGENNIKAKGKNARTPPPKKRKNKTKSTVMGWMLSDALVTGATPLSLSVQWFLLSLFNCSTPREAVLCAANQAHTILSIRPSASQHGSSLDNSF